MLFAIFLKVCVLVTLTFALTRTRFFPHLLRPHLPAREQIIALLVFLVMGFAEIRIANQPSPLNLRIVAVCAAGLLAGTRIGVLVGLAITAMACGFDGFPLPTIALSMVLAGWIGGILHHRRPELALHPATGLVFGASISLLRYALVYAFVGFTHTYEPAQDFQTECLKALMHGLGVGLILLVVAQTREQEAQVRAAAMAEVRALQARMQPHFLFNALNTLSALSLLDPHAVPGATARLGLFLRASLDQHDRPFVSLQEELDIVAAYLDIERLRLGERLVVVQEIAPKVLTAAVPPFLLQPLVENAIQHGIQPCLDGGTIRITVSEEAEDLVLTVADNGSGISPDIQENLFCADACHIHALPLLRRRLEGLYGRDFLLAVDSVPENGTAVTLRLPLRCIERDAESTIKAVVTGRREHTVSRLPLPAGRRL